MARLRMALAKKIRMPFTVALVLVGIALAQVANLGGEALSGVLNLDMPPELVFFVLLPALVFESAFNLEVRALRENLSPVLMLAVPGLLISQHRVKEGHDRRTNQLGG